jgi:hypothetical protein
VEIQSGYAADFEHQGWSRIQGSGEISNDIFFGLYIRIIEGKSQELIVNVIKRDDLGKEGQLVILSLGEK